MDGLPEDYDAFITFVTSRLDPYTVEDIEALLLAEKERFDKHKSLDRPFIQVNTISTHWNPSASSRSPFRGTNLCGGRGSARHSFNKRQPQFRDSQKNSWSGVWDSSSSQPLRVLRVIPSINKNLISVSKFVCDNNVFFEFYPNQCFVKNQATKEILLQGNIRDGSYVFPSLHRSLLPSVNTSSHNSIMTPYELWHKRLGHASSRTVQNVMQMNNKLCNKNSSFCDSCVIAKSHQLPFSFSHTVYIAPLQLVFVDIWGPSHVIGSDGSMYYISFLDAFSRYTWLYLIISKSQATAVFLCFKLLA